MSYNVNLYPRIYLDCIGEENSILYDLWQLLIVRLWAEIQGRMYLNKIKPFQVESSVKNRLSCISFSFQRPTASALVGYCFLFQADPSSDLWIPAVTSRLGFVPCKLEDLAFSVSSGQSLFSKAASIQQVVLNVLLMTFCVFPEPWRTWKIILLSSPHWDPSTTLFHSVWRGCLGCLRQDLLKAPYRFSTSRGCRWGVFSLVMPAVSFQCGCIFLLIPGIGIDLIKIWPFFLKLIFMQAQ